MTDGARELLVLRHAKAVAFATSDHDRELTRRGIADATDAGEWAREHGVLPDHVFVSSAARTQGTWAAFQAGSACEAEVSVDRSLYSAGTDGALEVVRSAPDEARRVLVIGHNPTMAHLVHLLDDGTADERAFAQLSAGYPTSALTVLRFTGPWSKLDFAGARIVAFHVGRG